MKKLLLIAAGAALLFSCSTSNDVVSNGFIQKRKYTKGWHINKRANVSSKKGTNTPEKFTEEKEADLTLSTEPKTIKNQDRKDVEVAIVANELPKPIEKAVTSKEVKHSQAKKTTKASVGVEDNKIETNSELVTDYSVKEVKPAIKMQKNAGADGAGGVLLLLLVVLALFIPWLSVGIYDGWAGNRWIINLLLWILGGGLYIFGVGFAVAGIFFVIAVVHAILILLGFL